MTGANFPLGIWKYDKFNMKHIDIENEYPDQIDKYCGLFRTLGDRRLQTNLFQGLHKLIQIAYSAGKTSFNKL